MHNAVFRACDTSTGWPLALRLYLVPIFWMAGARKIAGMDQTVEWFGNPDWGLGLPFSRPAGRSGGLYRSHHRSAVAVTGPCYALDRTPLMVTMLVAIFAVHWDYGWAAIADSGIPGSGCAHWHRHGYPQRARHYAWLTEKRQPGDSQQWHRIAVTYFIMLLSLLFTGGGAMSALITTCRGCSPAG